MRLDIIVPHYKEPWETCKYLFDSIMMQRGIRFDDIKVMVVNDGDCLLDVENFKGYPYKIEYLIKPHGGISDTRNYGIEHSDADYIMFCDIDDGFLNNYSLHLFFKGMEEGFDLCVSNFVEETFDSDGNQTIVAHDQDVTFVHGKAYRRQFLIDYDLKFDPQMTLHEDGYFNLLVYAAAHNEGKIKKLTTPTYMWRWNEESVVRKDRGDFVLKTYEDVMLTRIGVCQELKRRGYIPDYQSAMAMTVLNSYYDFQKPRYHLPQNEKHLRKAEKAFKKFWLMYRDEFNGFTNRFIADTAALARENAVQNGMLMEQQDLRSFLKHIEYEVK